MLLVGFEPEEESPIVFLRLRKAVRTPRPAGLRGRAVRQPAGWPSCPATLLADRCRAPRPGADRARRRPSDGPPSDGWTPTAGAGSQALTPGAVILVGERLADRPGRARRGGHAGGAPPARGSPGCRAGPASAARSRPAPCPACCPAAARSPTPAARVDVAAAWGVGRCPPRRGATPRRSSRPRRRRARRAWWSAGVDPDDLPDPAAALRASRWRRSWSASSCGPARSPTGPTWSSRSRRWPRRPARSSTGRAAAARSRPRCAVPEVRTDLYVLGAIADEMDVHLGLPDAAAARAELAALGPGAASAQNRPPGGPRAHGRAAAPASGRVWGRSLPGHAGHLAPAARQRPDAGRRAVPGRHGPRRWWRGCRRRPRPRPAWPTARR